MRKSLQSRTWPVFVVGLGSLLALLFLPGIAALRRSDEIYGRSATFRRHSRHTQKSLDGDRTAAVPREHRGPGVAAGYAPVEGTQYRSMVADGRETINRELASLHRGVTGVNCGIFRQLESELERYWAPSNRCSGGRPRSVPPGNLLPPRAAAPRRQSILAIAGSIRDLTDRCTRSSTRR